MPVQQGQDRNGPFYRWGAKGKKYYYTPGNEKARQAAQAKASEQGKAVHAAKS